MKPGHKYPRHRKWHLQCTDAGSDEKKVRDYAQFIISRIPWAFGMADDCMQHQLHIINSGLLKTLDQWLVLFSLTACLTSVFYFSLIATLANTLREYSARCKERHLELYPGTTLRFAGKLPPRCLSGRWMSSINFVEWVLQRGFEKLRAILNAVIADLPSASGAPAGGASAPRDETDELTAEQREAKLSKWKLSASKSLRCTQLEARQQSRQGRTE